MIGRGELGAWGRGPSGNQRRQLYMARYGCCLDLVPGGKNFKCISSDLQAHNVCHCDLFVKAIFKKCL